MLLLSLQVALLALCSTDVDLICRIRLIDPLVNDSIAARQLRATFDSPDNCTESRSKWNRRTDDVRSKCSGIPPAWIRRERIDVVYDKPKIEQRVCKRAGRVSLVQWIIIDVCIEVKAILIPNRIRLHEPPKGRVVKPRLVVIEPELRHRRLPRVLEAPGVGGRSHAIRVVRVDLQRGARRGRERDDRALVVGMQVAAARRRD